MSGFDDLFWLVEVVDAGTFSGAANKHGISSAAVSKRIRLMEERLSANLLVRTTRHLRMTEVGEMYYLRGKQLLEEFNHLEHSVTSANEQLSGRIRVNAPMSYGLSDLVKPVNEFMRQYPDVDVTLHFEDRTIDIFNSNYDIVIRVGQMPDSSLVAQRLANIKMLCCASPEYLAEYGEPESPQELVNHKCLVYQQDDTYSTWKFAKNDQVMRVDIQGPLISNSGDYLCQLACLGQGIVYHPEFIVRAALVSGELVAILTEYQTASVDIQAVYPTRHYLPLKVKRFIEFLKARLNE